MDLSGDHWAVSVTSGGPVFSSSFDEFSKGPIETLGRTLSVFMGFQFKPQQHFHAKLWSCLCILFSLNPIKGLAIYRWAGVFPGISVSTSTASAWSKSAGGGACWLLVLRPEADAPCPEQLRASCSEGYLFACMTLSLFINFRVWGRQMILLHNRYLHFSWKLGN